MAHRQVRPLFGGMLPASVYYSRSSRRIFPRRSPKWAYRPGIALSGIRDVPLRRGLLWISSQGTSLLANPRFYLTLRSTKDGRCAEMTLLAIHTTFGGLLESTPVGTVIYPSEKNPWKQHCLFQAPIFFASVLRAFSYHLFHTPRPWRCQHGAAPRLFHSSRFFL